jgi:hypothetical protein
LIRKKQRAIIIKIRKNFKSLFLEIGKREKENDEMEMLIRVRYMQHRSVPMITGALSLSVSVRR